MDLSYEVKESYAEIKAAGRLNMVSAPKLREMVADVIAEGTSRIVVNRSDDVGSIDQACSTSAPAGMLA